MRLIGSNPGAGLFVLRVAVGAVFVVHGLGKLLGPPLGSGMAAFQTQLTQLGLPEPTILAWVGVGVELVGGVALILGAGVAAAGILLAVENGVAMATLHWQYGFDVYHVGDPTARGYEYVLVLAAASLAIALGGPGILAIQLRPKQD